MEFYIGTSGYSYSEWKGKFYPAGLPAKARLGYYAQHFRAVEINNTFYRMPAPAMLAGWAGQVPGDFRFTFKAPGRITHQLKLRGAEDATHHFIDVVRSLGEHAGPLLFQLPPTFGRDDDRLAAFLGLLPRDTVAAFEFRHPSWHDESVYALLRARGIALCLTDTDEGEASPLVATADWGYLRLRRAEYSEAEIGEWLARIRAQPWQRAYIFYKHEDEATGPRFARTMRSLFGDVVGR